MTFRPSFAAFALLACAFVGGFASAKLLEGTAHAGPPAFASTMYIPSDGLAFRTFDGHLVARLSYNTRGGVLDVYDNREHPAISVRADMLRPAASFGADMTCNPPFTVDVVGTKHPKAECL
jgi:hypothetical protein